MKWIPGVVINSISILCSNSLWTVIFDSMIEAICMNKTYWDSQMRINLFLQFAELTPNFVSNTHRISFGDYRSLGSQQWYFDEKKKSYFMRQFSVNSGLQPHFAYIQNIFSSPYLQMLLNAQIYTFTQHFHIMTSHTQLTPISTYSYLITFVEISKSTWKVNYITSHSHIFAGLMNFSCSTTLIFSQFGIYYLNFAIEHGHRHIFEYYISYLSDGNSLL